MKKITALFFFFVHFSAFAAIDALNFASPQQESDYHALTQELRCPQCQNNNIADSNATIAVDMRAKVFELLQEGKQKQEIVDYMIARYGHFVTYNPPLTAATLALWVVPALLVLFGVVIIFRRKPRAARSATKQSAVNFEQESLSEAQQQRLNALLKEKE